MPVWHAATKELRESGELTVIGIVQEQHPERAELFAQWQGFDWPILWDAFNLLDLSAVPIVCAVDEYGQVRSTRLRPSQIDEPGGLRALLLEPTFEPPKFVAAPESLLHTGLAEVSGDPAPGTPLATLQSLAFFVYGSRAEGDLSARFERGVDSLRAWAERPEALPADLFRLGVALRLRYDSPYAQESDFQESLDAWSKALAGNPAQYIWRRRIQQWGPRLDKPYPFYNWVEQAAQEVTARGEVPVALRVPLTGSERAARQGGKAADVAAVEPDPEAGIPQDELGWLAVSAAVAPHSGDIGKGAGKAAAAARVHLSLTPSAEASVHWTNDAGASVVWLEAPAGWSVEPALHELVPGGESATSSEVRRLDFGVVRAPGAESGPAVLRGYVLAYLCSGEDGECSYLRRDFEVELPASQD